MSDTLMTVGEAHLFLARLLPDQSFTLYMELRSYPGSEGKPRVCRLVYKVYDSKSAQFFESGVGWRACIDALLKHHQAGHPTAEALAEANRVLADMKEVAP